MGRPLLRRAALLVLVLLAPAPAPAAAPTVPAAEWLLEQVKILSAPDTEGRASGTAGAERAARHLADAFRQTGLAPGGDSGGYLQAFPVSVSIRLGINNSLVFGAGTRVVTVGPDFAPLAVSGDGVAEGELIFAGYGITAPDLGYDDYAGIDVRGKIVLVLNGEPGGADPASPFRRPDAYHYAERGHKILNARLHGAAAVLVVTHPRAPREGLPALTGTSQSWSILAAYVSRAVADALLAPSGRRLADVADAIDRALAPQSFVVGGRLLFQVNLLRDRGPAFNVVGVLPGTDPALRHEAVVIGGHYDHLGRGGEGSLAPDQVGVIHPGADDNASGTAAVMALARAFGAIGGAPRTLVFVAFAGEEMGLLGSAHYVRNPPHPLDRTVLMVNLDMVGRVRDGKVYVGGVDSGVGLRALVRAQRGGLSLELRGDPWAPSDHVAFYANSRPVLFVTTGAHADYHRPTDTWDKLNATGLQAVTAFVARVVAEVARQPVAPAYVRVAPPAAPRRPGGYGPSFGIVPDFGEAGGPGVKISGVRPGSPAERAGVRTGDVIVAFGGVTVKTLEDLTFALRSHRSGDRVEVRILRDGVERGLEAVLEQRGE